jgi:hypothetical protein
MNRKKTDNPIDSIGEKENATEGSQEIEISENKKDESGRNTNESDEEKGDDENE